MLTKHQVALRLLWFVTHSHSGRKHSYKLVKIKTVIFFPTQVLKSLEFSSWTQDRAWGPWGSGHTDLRHTSQAACHTRSLGWQAAPVQVHPQWFPDSSCGPAGALTL